MSPLLNYTTEVGAAKTVGQIQGILAGHGARSILMDYGDDGHIEALAFQVPTPHGNMSIRLPIDPDSVLKVLQEQRVAPRYRTRAQAIRIAWRIVKDWVEAQMAILETEMVKMEQIFLPYLITKDGQTVYELFEQSKFKMLGAGE